MAEWDAKDKTFLITGGASGLGAEYAKSFLELGAKKVAILDIAEDLGKTTAERLNNVHGSKVVFIKCDVSKEADITNAFDSVLAQFKQIDVIVNNAGIMVDAPNMWSNACDVNWKGLVSFTLKGVIHMRKDEGGAGGTIINIASTAALVQVPFLPIYSGSKIAVLHFSQCLAVDPFYENTGIRVLTLCPGPTDTPLLHNLEKRSYEPKLGKAFQEFVECNEIIYQKVESVVKGFLVMYKTGAPGSVWVCAHNNPVKDITSTIKKAFKDFENTTLA